MSRGPFCWVLDGLEVSTMAYVWVTDFHLTQSFLCSRITHQKRNFEKYRYLCNQKISNPGKWIEIIWQFCNKNGRSWMKHQMYGLVWTRPCKTRLESRAVLCTQSGNTSGCLGHNRNRHDGYNPPSCYNLILKNIENANQDMLATKTPAENAARINSYFSLWAASADFAFELENCWRFKLLTFFFRVVAVSNWKESWLHPLSRPAATGAEASTLEDWMLKCLQLVGFQ